MYYSIGLLNPAIHRIRVGSVITFSVLCMCVFLGFVTFFLILLQYDIRPLDSNCDVCALEFAAGVNLRRHDTLPDPNWDVCAPEFATGVNLRRHDILTGTKMNVMMIFC